MHSRVKHSDFSTVLDLPWHAAKLPWKHFLEQHIAIFKMGTCVCCLGYGFLKWVPSVCVFYLMFWLCSVATDWFEEDFEEIKRTLTGTGKEVNNKTLRKTRDNLLTKASHLLMLLFSLCMIILIYANALLVLLCFVLWLCHRWLGIPKSYCYHPLGWPLSLLPIHL